MTLTVQQRADAREIVRLAKAGAMTEQELIAAWRASRRRLLAAALDEIDDETAAYLIERFQAQQ